MRKELAAAPGRTSPDLETRARLLKAAERLFAERGFKKVTVRDICRAARANVAAVNYHFGDKTGLYREVLQIAIDAVRTTTEAARRAGEGCPPEEQLRRYFSVFLQSALAAGHENLHQLIQREIDDPSVALDAFVDEAVRPRVEYIASIVAAMTGHRPSDPLTLRCVGSILAQAIPYVRQNPIAERLGFRFRGAPAEIEAAARHIAEFSAAGVRAVLSSPLPAVTPRYGPTSADRRTS
jgi:AcrR family transcriptional regulator